MADDSAAARHAGLVALDIDAKHASHIASDPRKYLVLVESLSTVSITAPPKMSQALAPESDARRRAAAPVNYARGNKTFSVDEGRRLLLLGAVGEARIGEIVGLAKGTDWIAGRGAKEVLYDAAGVRAEIDLGAVEGMIEAAMEEAREDVVAKRYRLNTGIAGGSAQ